MPKQIVFSKDFFVNASEVDARRHILEIPDCISTIKFIEENPVRNSIRFKYGQPAELLENYDYIEVSLLPLNVHQTRITLQSACFNRTILKKNFKIKNALFNFESAINASVKGNLNEYVPQQIKYNNPGWGIVLVLIGVAGIIYLIKDFFI